jgi:hypothetical protein
MPGLVAGIHVFGAVQKSNAWMAGINPAMTVASTPAASFGNGCASARVQASVRIAYLPLMTRRDLNDALTTPSGVSGIFSGV